jgi:hypothetical protein
LSAVLASAPDGDYSIHREFLNGAARVPLPERLYVEGETGGRSNLAAKMTDGVEAQFFSHSSGSVEARFRRGTTTPKDV